MKTKTLAKDLVNGRASGHSLPRLVLQFLFGCKPRWKESQLITSAGIVYTVRDAPGHEREIKSPWDGQWRSESEVKHSWLPHFEKQMLREYETAKPYTQNASDQGRA